MNLRSVTLQNLYIGPLYGMLGFRVDMEREGEIPPSSIAKTIADSVRRTVKTHTTVPIVFPDIGDDLYSVVYALRQETFPFQLQYVWVVEEGKLGVTGSLMDLIIVRCSESTWTGTMGGALIMTLEKGMIDPTAGYPLNMYPLGYWLEKGDKVSNEEFLRYTLKYPKWRIVVPPRTIYSWVVYQS